jgi:hypothetical protein
LGVGARELVITVAAIVFMEWVERDRAKQLSGAFLADKPRQVRWLVYGATVMMILLFGKMNPQRFIYFQF